MFYKYNEFLILDTWPFEIIIQEAKSRQSSDKYGQMLTSALQQPSSSSSISGGTSSPAAATGRSRYRTLPHHHSDRSRLILAASNSGYGIAGGGGGGTATAAAVHSTSYDGSTDFGDTSGGLYLRTPSVRTLELLKEKRESIV